MWRTISKRLSKSSWLRSTGSRGGKGTTTTHVEKSPKPEPTISSAETSSNYTSYPREEDWPIDDSFIMSPDFSDPMSDNLSEEYQSREMTRAPKWWKNLRRRERVSRIHQNGYKSCLGI